jgi:hypothetical protein
METTVHHQTERGARIALAKKQINRASYEAVLRGEISLAQAKELGCEGPHAPTSRGGAGAVTEGPRKGRECLCSCGGETRGGRFLPGHDMRLYGELKRNLERDPLLRNERFNEEQTAYARQRGLI